MLAAVTRAVMLAHTPPSSTAHKNSGITAGEVILVIPSLEPPTAYPLMADGVLFSDELSWGSVKRVCQFET